MGRGLLEGVLNSRLREQRPVARREGKCGHRQRLVGEHPKKLELLGDGPPALVKLDALRRGGRDTLEIDGFRHALRESPDGIIGARPVTSGAETS